MLPLDTYSAMPVRRLHTDYDTNIGVTLVVLKTFRWLLVKQ